MSHAPSREPCPPRRCVSSDFTDTFRALWAPLCQSLHLVRKPSG